MTPPCVRPEVQIQCVEVQMQCAEVQIQPGRLTPGEWVQYTRKALDMLHMPGDDGDPNPHLWGVVLSVSDHPHGGVVTWRHQRGISRCFGTYLCRCDTDTLRERGCGGCE